jgi:hypothetical protein
VQACNGIALPLPLLKGYSCYLIFKKSKETEKNVSETCTNLSCKNEGTKRHAGEKYC